MNELIAEIHVDSTAISYIQFLNSQKTAYKDILTEILIKNKNGYDYNKETYEHFMEGYKEICFRYDSFTVEVLQEYAPEYVGSKDHMVEFDFAKNMLFIKESNTNSCCSIGGGCKHGA